MMMINPSRILPSCTVADTGRLDNNKLARKVDPPLKHASSKFGPPPLPPPSREFLALFIPYFDINVKKNLAV